MKTLIQYGVSILIISGCVALTPLAFADANLIKEGERLAFDRAKGGNCIACHAMPNADPKKNTLPGTIGPPLVAMKIRYPDRKKLFSQIWDATLLNPNSIMPPFGKNHILTKEEVEAITAYIHTL